MCAVLFHYWILLLQAIPDNNKSSRNDSFVNRCLCKCRWILSVTWWPNRAVFVQIYQTWKASYPWYSVPSRSGLSRSSSVTIATNTLRLLLFCSGYLSYLGWPFLLFSVTYLHISLQLYNNKVVSYLVLNLGSLIDRFTAPNKHYLQNGECKAFFLVLSLLTLVLPYLLVYPI